MAEPTRTAWEMLADILDVPGRTIRAPIIEGMEASKEGKQLNPFDYLGAAGRGLYSAAMGEGRKYPGQKIYELAMDEEPLKPEEGWSPEAIKRALAGLGIEMAADVPGFGLAKKGLQLAGRGVGAVARATGAADIAANVAANLPKTRVGQAIGTTFTPQYLTKMGIGAAGPMEHSGEYYRRLRQMRTAESKHATEFMEKAAEYENLIPDTELRNAATAMSENINIGKTVAERFDDIPAGTPDDVVKWGRAIQSDIEEMIEKGMNKRGILNPEDVRFKDKMSYMPHIVVPAEEESIMSSVMRLFRNPTKYDEHYQGFNHGISRGAAVGTTDKAGAGAFRRKDIRKLSELNADSLHDGFGRVKYVNDIVDIFQKKGGEVSQQFAANDFLTGLVNDGLYSTKRGKGMREFVLPKRMKNSRVSKLLKGKYFDSNFVDDAERMIDAVKSKKDLGAAFKIWDDFSKYWKASALARPAFHVANGMSGLLVNHLNGINLLKPKTAMFYSKIAKAANLYRQGKFSQIKKMGNVEGRNMLDWLFMARDHGVLSADRSLMGDVIEMAQNNKYSKNMVKGLAKEVKNVFAGKGAKGKAKAAWEVAARVTPISPTKSMYLQASAKAGQFTEDTLRTSLFINNAMKHYKSLPRANKSWSEAAEKAALDVSKWHVDYSDLTNAERELFKRILPWYAWVRKSVPVYLQAMLEHPQTFNRIFKARGALQQAAYPGLETKDIPEYYREQMPIFTPFQQEYGDKKRLEMMGMERFLAPSTALRFLTAAKKTVTGEESRFPGSPLLQFGLESSLPAYNAITEAISNYSKYKEQPLMRHSADVEPLMGLMVPKTTAHFARGIVPLLGSLNKLMRGTLTAGVPNDLSPINKILQFVIARTYQVDLDQNRRREAYKILKDIEKIRRDIRYKNRDIMDPEKEEYLEDNRMYIERLRDALGEKRTGYREEMQRQAAQRRRGF